MAKTIRIKTSNIKLLHSRWRFLLTTIASGFLFIILPSVIIQYYTQAAPYRPPPPPPPIPPPEEPPPPPEYPEFIATPTPCIPNWCFVKQTQCCFDPICVFLSETEKIKNNRCPKPPPSDVQYLGRKPDNINPENPNAIFSFLNLFFKKR